MHIYSKKLSHTGVIFLQQRTRSGRELGTNNEVIIFQLYGK